MKIMFIIPIDYKSVGWGGVTAYTLLIAQELKRLNHKITILTPGEKNRVYKYRGIPVYTIKYYEKYKIPGERLLVKLFPMFIDRLKWIYGVYSFVYRNSQFDIIESPEWGASGLLISLYKKHKVNIRLHRSQYQYYLDNKLPINIDLLLVNMLEMISILLSSSITSPTTFMFKTHSLLTWFLKIKCNPSEVIPNGIKITNHAINKRSITPYILYVGRLEYGKGLHTLIQAFSEIKNKHHNIRLILIGRDMKTRINNAWISYKQHLLSIIKKKRMQKTVLILAQKNQYQLEKYYANCLLYVMPARGHENHPIALLDAIGWNKAVITSNAGGIPEIIKDQKSGLVFKQDNAHDCARTLSNLLSNVTLRNSIEKYNTKYKYNFNIRDVTVTTANFFTKVIHHK